MIQIGMILIVSVLFLVVYVTGWMATVSESHPAVILGAGLMLSAIAGSFLGSFLFLALNQDTYYLPCEIVAANDYCTYFGTVDSDSQKIYAVETGDHIWPDDVPYLLHMDSKGTKDTKDDEVLVVWRTD
jgi:hypothetical protein